MTILVTGAAGFIGTHLVHRLTLDGHRVVGIDALTDYYAPAIKRANLASQNDQAFEFVEADLNALDLYDLLDKTRPTAIVHLAGQPGVRSSWGTSFGVYTRNNIDATQRLLEAVREWGHPIRVIYASSSSVYGQAECYPTKESFLPQPFSPYGVTKLAGEHLVELYRNNFGIDTLSLRFFTVYGPRQRPDMAFARFVRQLRAGAPLTIYGDGEQEREFTYAADIVEAIVLAITAPTLAHKVLNLSGGASASVNQVIAALQSISGQQLPVDYRPSEQGDVRRTGGDAQLAYETLGWRPQISLYEGLELQYRHEFDQRWPIS